MEVIMGLLHFLKGNKEARKIFGQRELKIIEKQLMGMKLSRSEKNRLSRDIRAKLKFVKDISRFSEEFRLKKSAQIDKLIDEAVEVILDHKWYRKIKKILLFGSIVTNEMNLSSDIDIAVVFDDISKRNAGEFRIHVLGRVNNKMDIQVYNTLPEKIKKSIDNANKTIFKRKDG